MRITSGKYRGREVKSPLDARTHPMGERERLALFNTLMSLRGDIKGATVMDAYAGSGTLGIEALSRGAGRAVFVEKVPTVARIIRENLNTLTGGGSGGGLLPDRSAQRGQLGEEGETGSAGDLTASRVICSDVNNLSLDEEFDVILTDPPYDTFDPTEVEKLTKYLKDGGVLVLSHPEVAPELNGLTLEKTRQYARAHLSFYTK